MAQQGQQGPNKRQKIFRACDNCVSDKKRCDDVLPTGCHQCRRRSKTCSLAEAIHHTATGGHHNGHGHGLDAVHHHSSGGGGGGGGGSMPHTPHGLEAAIVDLQQCIAVNTARLDQLQASLESAAMGRGMSDWSRREQHRDQAMTRPGPPPRYHNPVMRPFDNWMQSLYGEDLFSTAESIDILARLALSQEDLDMAFSLFKHRLSRVMPLRPFDRIDTPTPTHPFLVLSILQHVPSVVTVNISELVDEAVGQVLRGWVSEEIVLGLLFLALAPAGSDKRGRISPLRCISLAYQIGLTLGLDAEVGAYAHDGPDLERVEPRLAEKVEMWCAVVNHYNLLQILYGRPARLAASPTAHFVHPHFREQAALLNGLAPFIGFFSRGEARQSWWVPDPEEILEAWGAAREHVGQWLRPESRLTIDAHLLDFSICMRAHNYVRNMPSPLGATKLGTAKGWPRVIEAMGGLLAYATRQFDQSHPFPEYITMSIAVSVACAWRTKAYVHRHYGTSSALFERFDVDHAADMVAKQGGPPATMLHHLQAVIDTDRAAHEARQFNEQIAAADLQTFANSLFGFDFDINWQQT